MIIDLSQNAQAILKEYLTIIDLEEAETTIPETMELGSVYALLLLGMKKDPAPNEELLAATLCTALLQSIDASYSQGSILPKQTEPDTPASKSKLVLLVLAGVLVVACEGFDGVTTILSILSLPSFLVFIAGLVFSVLSVILFCSFDILQVARQLGVSLWEGPKLLNTYLDQLQTIKTLRRKIEGYSLAELSVEELSELEKILFLLQERLDILRKRCAGFDLALNSSTTIAAKFLIAGMSGMLFFGGGFFAGQSVAAFVLATFFASFPAFWPVLIFSCFVGLAAFSVYWCLERPGVQKLISSWFGLDEDKVELLCDKDKHDREQSKLDLLQQNVRGTLDLKQQVNRYGFYSSSLDRELTPADSEVNVSEISSSCS